MNFLRHLFTKDHPEEECVQSSDSKYDALFLEQTTSGSGTKTELNSSDFPSQKPQLGPSVTADRDLKKRFSSRRSSEQTPAQDRKPSVQSEVIILSADAPAASSTHALAECTLAISQYSNIVQPIRMTEDEIIADDQFDDALGEFRQRRAYTNPVQMFHEPRSKKIKNISEPIRSRATSAFSSPSDSPTDGDGENFTNALLDGKLDCFRHPSLRDRQRSNKYKYGSSKCDRPRSYSGSPVHKPYISNQPNVEILGDTLSKALEKSKTQSRKERPPSLGVLEEILAGVTKEKPPRSSPTGGGSRRDHQARGSPGTGEFSSGAGGVTRPPASVRLCEIKILPNKNVSQVLPDLFLGVLLYAFICQGSREIAHDLQALRKLGITHILNVTSEIQDKFPEQFIYERIPINDMPSVRLSDYIPAAVRFIDSVRRPLSGAFPPTAAGKSATPSPAIGASSAARAAAAAMCASAGGKSAASSAANVLTADETNCAAAAEVQISNSNMSVVSNETASSTVASTPLASRTGVNPAGTGKVLVHCFYGNSRSASIVMAYLMKAERMRFADTLEFLQLLRPEVNPNEGFRRQLKEFDKLTFGS